MSEQRDAADRLDGWKDIASYLHKSVRTAIRWEKELGLPVRRLPGRGGEIVFALRSEIDDWLLRRPLPPGNPREAEPAAHDRDEPDVVSAPRGGVGRVSRARSFVVATAIIAALATGWTIANVTRADDRVTPSTANPASWRVEGDVLFVYDAAGRELWQHRFDVKLRQEIYTDPMLPRLSRPVRVADLDEDGHNEVLMRIHAADQANQELWCFEADGRLRFRHRFDGEVQFGDQRYRPPFPISGVFVDTLDTPPSVVAVAQHGTWFPSRVARLTPRGQLTSEYWSNGHVRTVSSGRVAGTRVLFVGGVDNENREASLAIIDRDVPGAAAPAENPAYRCRSCAAGQPRAFVVFPATTLASLVGSLPYVESVDAGRDDGLRVTVLHHQGKLPGDQEQSRANVFYVFDRRLRLQSVTLSDDFNRTRARAEVVVKTYSHQTALAEESRLGNVRNWNGARFVPVERAP